MKKIVNSFNVVKTVDGYEIRFVYSVINKEGEYIQKNLVKNLVAVDQKIISSITEIIDFLVTRIPDKEV